MSQTLPEADLVAVRPEQDEPGARLNLGALSWALFEGVRDPYVILITIYIFMPYVAGVMVGDPKTLGLIYWAGTHGLVNLYMAGKIGEPELRALHRQMTQTLARGARRPSEAKSRRPRAG